MGAETESLRINSVPNSRLRQPPYFVASVLKPRNTWVNQAEYDAQAAKLAKLFIDNFKSFEADVTPEVRAAGPKA